MEDYMKYDGRFPEPAYITSDSLAELTAERDRLAAENAELKERLDRRAQCIRDREDGEIAALATIDILTADLAAANATLDRLREVVPEGSKFCNDCRDWTMLGVSDEGEVCSECEYPEYQETDMCDGQPMRLLHAILYPKETDNGN